MNYTLTPRGKTVVYLMMLFFIGGIFFSGNYMVQYFQNDIFEDLEQIEGIVENIEPAEEPEEEPEEILYTEEATEDVDNEEIVDSEEEPEEDVLEDTRYTLDDLDSLSTLIMLIHFEDNRYDLNEDAYEDLGFMIYILEHYDQETITLASQRSYIGDMRRKVVLEYLVNRGIDSSRISLYNFYGKKSEEDHVELFFEHHYDGSGYSK